MITVIYAGPGAGKGCLQTHLVEELYHNSGFDIFTDSCALIDEINSTYKRNLTKPDRVPIFTDFEVKFKVDYEKFYSTYFLNGYYFGLENDRLPTMYVPPGSKIFLSEVQRYYDARKHSSLPDFVSRAYEMHRHFKIDFTMDLQRLGLLDLNIKELASRFIYIEKLNVVKNIVGDITLVEWFCREFDFWKDADAYIDENRNVGRPIVFRHFCDVFENYNSFSNCNKFIPDKYHDFVYAEHTDKSIYSEILMPEGYRLNGKSKTA